MAAESDAGMDMPKYRKNVEVAMAVLAREVERILICCNFLYDEALMAANILLKYMKQARMIACYMKS